MNRLWLAMFVLQALIITGCGTGQNTETAAPTFCPTRYSAELPVPLAENAPPRAYYQQVTTTVETPLDIVLYACDPDDPTTSEGLAWEVAVPPFWDGPPPPPWNGDLSAYMGTYPESGVITYTPDPGFTGTDSFPYHVWDGQAWGNTATIEITVTQAPSGTGQKVLFGGDDGSGKGVEPWAYDPLNDTVVAVPEINPSGSSNPYGEGYFEFEYIGDFVYFAAEDDTSGAEPWVYDPAINARSRIADINTSPFSGSDPVSFSELNGKVYFGAYDGVSGAELWEYDPSISSLNLVADINTTSPGASSWPEDIVALGSKIYFSASEGVNGYELWEFDPAGPSFRMVADVNTTTTGASSWPGFLVALNGKIYFAANDGLNGDELWEYDPGVVGGPGHQMVADINTSVTGASSYPGDIVVLGGRLYFAASDGITGAELWEYDPGVVSGPAHNMVADINTAVGMGSYPAELVVAGGKVYFAAWDSINGTQLWSYDPGITAHSMVSDINTTGSANPRGLTAMNGKIYFGANDGTHGRELWEHDPSTGLSRLVLDLWPGLNSGYY